MSDQGDHRKRLVSLLGEVAVGRDAATLVEGVKVFRASESCRGPSSISRGFSSSARAGSGPFSAAKPTGMMPTTTSSYPCRYRRVRDRGEPRKPLLLLAIHVEPAMSCEMILELDEPSRPATPTPRESPRRRWTEEMAGPHPAPGVLQKPSDQPRPSAARRSAKSSIACSRASRAGPCVPWRAGRPFCPHRPGPEASPRRIRDQSV